MSLVFGLFSAVLALVTMRLLETASLDRAAYVTGIVASGLVGVAVVRALGYARRTVALRRVAWLVVPCGGAVVGMLVQAIICIRAPLERPILLASGLSTYEPARWVLCGIPFGAIPALVGAAVLALALRAGEAGAHDARERMTVPFAGACAVLAAIALLPVRDAELAVVGVVLLLALGAWASSSSPTVAVPLGSMRCSRATKRDSRWCPPETALPRRCRR